MAQEIYNEGRVVGLSAYEQYVKQAIELDPNSEPASEREWLASSLAMGSSMLLKITTFRDSGVHYRDIPLPPNSRLCAANTIIASFFDGDGNFSGNSEWADRVTDYGQLISNTSSSSPSGSNVPIKSLSGLSDTTVSKMLNYIKLADGIVIQPGTWTNTDADKNPPRKDLSPNLVEVPIVRLLFTGDITTEFNVLLTGFTNRVVVQGTSGIDTSTNTASPQDGDFLGPAAFPWSAKITFTTPSALTYYLQQNGIKAAEGEDEQKDGSSLPYDNVIVGEADSDGAKTIEVRKQISPAKGNVVIKPDNNEHQSEVSIDVKNEIYALTPDDAKRNTDYLIVNQRDEQSLTSIKVIPSNMVKPGVGISISADSYDGSLTVTNQFPNYNDDSSRIPIYPDAIADASVPQYNIMCFNNWHTGAYPLSRIAAGASRAIECLNVTINPAVDAEGELVACSISIGTQSSMNLGDLASQYASYGLSGDFCGAIMHPAVHKDVTLSHSFEYIKENKDDGENWNNHEYADCVIYRVRFTDGDGTGVKKVKLYEALMSAATGTPTTDKKYRYEFRNTTSGSAGIWNLQQYSGAAWSWPAWSSGNYQENGQPIGWRGAAFGASWDVYCAPALLTTKARNDAYIGTGSSDSPSPSNFYTRYIKNMNNTGDLQLGDIYIRAISIADGYNSQFFNSPYDGKTFGTTSSNLGVTALVYRVYE